MPRNDLQIAIVGHVDHGKSTLIGRLLIETRSLSRGRLQELKRLSQELGKDMELAYLCDHLKEERENDMTIDTTHLCFRTARTNFLIIDAPGHLELIKNMLTGASQANGTVLVIDCAQGIQEQTRRHAFLIKMLGIEHVLAVFNKMDLLGYQQDAFLRCAEELKSFTDTLGLKITGLIPISAKAGVNITRKSRQTTWYKGPPLVAALESLPSLTKASPRPLRLPIQDVYAIDGQRVIVGQIASGNLKASQKVRLLPSRRTALAKQIKLFNKNPRSACEGQSIGLVLSDQSLGKRGDVIVPANDALLPVRAISGSVFWLSGKPLQVNDRVTLKCATQSISAHVERIQSKLDPSTLAVLEVEAKALSANETATVVLKTTLPAIAEPYDGTNALGRFTIERDGSTQGVGIISGSE
jgi:small GTP-binding protein